MIEGFCSATRKRTRMAALASASAQCARMSWMDHRPAPGFQFHASRGTLAKVSRSRTGPFSYRSINSARSAAVYFIRSLPAFAQSLARNTGCDRQDSRAEAKDLRPALIRLVAARRESFRGSAHAPADD